MGTYLSGTTTEIYFAGQKIGELKGFTAEPTTKWSENDFIGNPVKQYIPIKVDATGTIERLVPDWQMFALALGYTHHVTSSGEQIDTFFMDGENNADVLWRYLEEFDLPDQSTALVDIDADTKICEFVARCPEINYIKLKCINTGITSAGFIVLDVIKKGGSTSVATFLIPDTDDLTSLEWVEFAAASQDSDLEIGETYEIKVDSTSTTADGFITLAKSFKYNASPNISAFVLGMKQNANVEGFVIKVVHYKADGDVNFVEEYTGVKLTKSGFDISPMELTTVSIDWYAAAYGIRKTLS